MPPRVGFDAGVHALDENTCVVIASDPCVGVPEGWFGWLLIHYAASDVALFGATPRYCSIELLGPPRARPSAFRRAMNQASRAARKLGMDIVTGHTGTYDGLNTVIGTCTAYGFVKKRDLITPAMAKANGRILCTKYVGLELLTNFALSKPGLAKKMFGPQRAGWLAGQMPLQSCVREALHLVKRRLVSAMHDATEGGLVVALNELADASQLGFRIDWERIPMLPELGKLADQYGLSRNELLASSSTGMILAAVPARKTATALRALQSMQVRGAIIGHLTSERRRLLSIDGRERKFPSGAIDPYAKLIHS